MDWTSETPTKPGYYWMRYPGEKGYEMVVTLSPSENGDMWASFHEELMHLSLFMKISLNREWCGPLTPPE